MAITAESTPNLLPEICKRLAERMVVQCARYEQMVAQHSGVSPVSDAVSEDEKNTIRNAYRLLTMYETRNLNAYAPAGVVGATSDNASNVDYEYSTDPSKFLHDSIESAINKSFPGKQASPLQEMADIFGALAGRSTSIEKVQQSQINAAKKFFAELNESLS